jgi:hypothetical protein
MTRVRSTDALLRSMPVRFTTSTTGNQVARRTWTTQDRELMVPLCSRHHHAAHEGGWTLRLKPDTSTPDHRTRRSGDRHRGSTPAIERS